MASLTLTGHAADMPKLTRVSGHVIFFRLARDATAWTGFQLGQSRPTLERGQRARPGLVVTANEALDALAAGNRNPPPI
jgi:hypothetical protein